MIQSASDEVNLTNERDFRRLMLYAHLVLIRMLSSFESNSTEVCSALVQLSNTKTAQMAESRGSDTKSSNEPECFAVTQRSHTWLYEWIRARIQPQL